MRIFHEIFGIFSNFSGFSTMVLTRRLARFSEFFRIFSNFFEFSTVFRIPYVVPGNRKIDENPEFFGIFGPDRRSGPENPENPGFWRKSGILAQNPEF